MPQPCFCGSQQGYTQCCERLHLARQQHLTLDYSAAELMRSRFSAFCNGNIDYLVDSLYPESRSNDDHKQIQRTLENTHWLSLRVIEHTVVTDLSAEVEFIAFYSSRNNSKQVEQLHERSLFHREHHQWWYVSGEHLPPINLGRNEPCWCGSMLKFKKCHSSMKNTKLGEG